MARRDELELMTPGEVCELWHVSRRTVERMIADGRLPSVRIGNQHRIPRKVVRAISRGEYTDGNNSSQKEDPR